MDAMSVYVKLRELPPDRERVRTTYLAKHGVFFHWDGRGTLIGVELNSVTGEPVSVHENGEALV